MSLLLEIVRAREERDRIERNLREAGALYTDAQRRIATKTLADVNARIARLEQARERGAR